MEHQHSKKIFNTIESSLKSKKLADGKTRVTHGAQFSRGGAVLVWFLMLFVLIVSIVLIIQGLILVSIPLLLVILLMAVYIMDFQGVEFDLPNEQVRNYKSYLGYRIGFWWPLRNFKTIRIFQDTTKEERVMGSSYDTHRYYTLYLMNESQNQLIKLYEDESITRVRIFASKFSKTSGLNFNDKIGVRKTEIINNIVG